VDVKELPALKPFITFYYMQSASSGNRTNTAAAAAAVAYIFVFLLPCTRTLRFSCPEVDGKRKEEDM